MEDKAIFVYRGNGRKHPYNENITYNMNTWAWQSTVTGNMFTNKAQAEADEQPVVVKKVAAKKAAVKNQVI